MNRTTKYMYYAFDREELKFIECYNKLSIKSLYLGDDQYLINSGGVCYDKHLFVLVDVTKTNNFHELLLFLRCGELYEEDYVINNWLHMIVFKINPYYRQAFIHFKKGRYSKMFSPQYVSERFKKFENYTIKIGGKSIDKNNYPDIQELNGELIDISPHAVLTRKKELFDIIKYLYGIEFKNLKYIVELDSSPFAYPASEFYRFNVELHDEETGRYKTTD